MLRAVAARMYKRTDLSGTGLRLGFIAQELQAACPTASGNLLGRARYSSNRDGTDEREILTLDYGRLSAVLWQCCRSLLARVEALEARLSQ